VTWHAHPDANRIAAPHGSLRRHPLRPAPIPWRSAWLSLVLPATGICVALFGALVAVGWYAHWEQFIRVGVALPAMKLNAALSFVLCGIALALMSIGRKRAAMALSAVLIAIMGATLVEYASGHNFGLDEFLLHDYLTPANAYPGSASLRWPHWAASWPGWKPLMAGNAIHEWRYTRPPASWC